MDNADFYQKVKDYAFRLLSIRPRSSQELRKKLIAYCLKHKYPPSFADTLVLELIEKKYVNDLEFALWWRQQRELISPKSDRVIKMELKNKGIIDPEIILKVFDKSSNYSGKSEFEKASVIAVKKNEDI